jgi:dienelactone hydrolase
MRKALIAAVACAAVLVGAGPAAAAPLPYMEVTQPDDGSTPPATIILLHGGGWTHVGPETVAAVRPIAQRFVRWGYRAVNSDYRAGKVGLQDVLAVIDDQLAQRPDVPICLYGVSAGGHWAFEAALQRPQISCIVSEAGPTDLVSPGPTTRLGIVGKRVFGTQRRAYSPAFQASRLEMPILLEYADNDTTVPPRQGRLIANAAPDATLLTLPAGPALFVHSRVARPVLDATMRKEGEWLARVLPQPTT